MKKPLNPFDKSYKNCFKNVFFLPINVPTMETFTESQTVKIYGVFLTSFHVAVTAHFDVIWIRLCLPMKAFLVCD